MINMLTRTGFIGAGKMAEAIIAGLITRKFAAPNDIVASDVNSARLEELRERYGISTLPDNAGVAARAELCVLAVKPQQLDAVVRDLAPALGKGHLLVSIAAGKTTTHIESLVPAGRVVRVMPNIACLVGAGMNVFTRGTRATEEDAAVVSRLLSCCGQALELPESLFDAVTALSGSGPAFFAYLLDRLVDGAVAEGLSRDQALRLASQTMAGTAQLLMAGTLQPADLAAAVTSARGTTAAGREVLETADMADALCRTIRAAARRSRELGRT